MLNLSGLPFDEIVKEEIRSAASKYWRFSRIMISGGPSYDPDGIAFLDVHVTQSEALNDVIFSEEELLLSARVIFKNVIPADFPLQISVTPFTERTSSR